MSATCMKCGSDGVLTRWHARGYPYKGGCGYNDVSCHTEHLHRYCQTCQFNWSDPVLTAVLRPPTPEGGEPA